MVDYACNKGVDGLNIVSCCSCMDVKEITE